VYKTECRNHVITIQENVDQVLYLDGNTACNAMYGKTNGKFNFSFYKQWVTCNFSQVDASLPHSSPELEMLLSDLSADDDARRLSHIMACFARFWEDDYRAIAVHAAAGSDYDASFLKLLRSTGWVPGSDGELHAPCDVFSGSARDARALFCDWAVFVNPTAEHEVEEQQRKCFYEDIGICSELTPRLAIQLLNKMCSGTKYMKLAALKKVYKYISENWNDVDSSEASIPPMPVIFVPNRKTSSPFLQDSIKDKHFELLENVAIPGIWVAPAECVWSDPTYLVDSLRTVAGGFHVTHEMNEIATTVARALQDYYGKEFKSFFTDKLKVVEALASSRYIEIMLRAAEEFQNNVLRPHAVACILRVMNHFVFNMSPKIAASEQASDYDDAPEYISLLQMSTKISVPTALYSGLVCLKDICWSAHSSTSNLLDERGFRDTVLKICAPRDYPLSCQYGVYDDKVGKRESYTGKVGNILIHGLNDNQSFFYDKIWRVPGLSDKDIHERVEFLPGSGGVDWPVARPAACVPVCHILARALQRWSREHVPDPAAREAIRSSVAALSLVVVGEPVRVRRRWIFVSPVDGSEIYGNDAAEMKEAFCALDCAVRGCPRLYATEDVLTLNADPRAFARCFTELVSTDRKVIHQPHRQQLSSSVSHTRPKLRSLVSSVSHMQSTFYDRFALSFDLLPNSLS
jgi:hypothetical protein